MDSRHVTFDGHEVHYWHGGTGSPVLMIHGVGPDCDPLSLGDKGSILGPAFF
jgi:hypothetical protein